jgi:ribosomal-protein-alanine N-acetyltransferase
MPYEDLKPIYMRKAEAQRKLDEGKEMTRYCFRAVCDADVYEMSVIERLSFGEPWLEQSIRDDIALPYSDYVVCVFDRDDGDEILGYAGIHNICGEGSVTNIAVHPAARRCGIGSGMLAELMHRSETHDVSAFTLEVRVSDAGAITMYEKMGFVATGRRKNYYPKEGGAREDALIMWRREKG